MARRSAIVEPMWYPSVSNTTARSPTGLPSRTICSGVQTCGWSALAPCTGACIGPLMPSAAQLEPVATTTISAPYSSTSAAVRRVFGMSSHALAELLDLGAPVVRHAGPGPEAGQRRHPVQVAAHLLAGVDEVHAAHPALAEHHGALHAGRPGADDQHVVVGVARGGEALGMPAATVLLTRGRVLCAPDRRASLLPARHAHVAGDALADLVGAALLDLAREERVGDRGARGADDVALSGGDRLDHRRRGR